MYMVDPESADLSTCPENAPERYPARVVDIQGCRCQEKQSNCDVDVRSAQ